MPADLISEMDRLAVLALGGSINVGPVPESGDEHSVGGQLTAATSVARVDMLPSLNTRFVFVKRVIYRLARVFLHRQRDYNLAMIAGLADLNQQVAIMRHRTQLEANRHAATLSHLTLSVEDLGERLDQLADTIETQTERQVQLGLESALQRAAQQTETALAAERDARTQLATASTAAQSDVAMQLADLRVQLTRVTRIQQGLRVALLQAQRPIALSDGSTEPGRRVGRTPVPTESTDPGRTPSAGEADAFYQRFEDEYRGAWDDIRLRLEPYLDDLDPIRDLGGPVVDVGSGRGEWLQLLVESGFEAVGVDTNADAVARATERGLSSVHGDAIAYLNSQPVASVLAVTCFHVLEHLPADQQIELVRAALRCLKPGGKLILETPNPTNLNVGAAAFYLDPSHLRPVNPTYASFLLSDLGFADVLTRYLHPREGYQPSVDSNDPALEDELMWALRGPQDFAVIGTVGRDDEPSGD